MAASSACAEIAIRDWRTSEVDALASLLHASYDGRAAARFASEHTVRGWRGYVGNLVDHTACGSVLPHVTRLAFWRDSLVGAVLVTALAPATAHIAQVAVHPDWRRRQLGGRLIDEAMALAWDAGYARATLLSSAENAAAQALYRTRGFTPTAEFLSATLPLDPAVARAS